MKTIDAMRRSAVGIAPDATILEAAQLMEHANVGSLVVLDGTVPLGIVTDRDLIRRGLARGLQPGARVDGVMTSPVHTVGANSDIHTVFGHFRRCGVRRLVVVDGADVKGIITVDDMLVDLAGDLFDLSRPLEREMLIGHRDAPVPATT